MFQACFLVLFVLLSCLVLFHSAKEDNISYPPSCPPFPCGKLNMIGFPFSSDTNPECGLFGIYGCYDNVQRIYLGEGVEYPVDSFSQANTIHIVNQSHYNCESFEDMTLPRSSYFSFTITHNITLFKCPRNTTVSPDFPQKVCKDFIVYYNPPDEGSEPSVSPKCSMIQLPAANREIWEPNNISSLLAGEFSLQVQVSGECYNCYLEGGQCDDDMQGGFKCRNANIGDRRRALKLQLVIVILAAGFGILMMVVFYYGSKKFSSTKSVIFWENKENQTNQNVEVFLKNRGSFAPKRYSYSDVKRMTNSFRDELGKGGFGCVYKGKLNDDRLVAVKILNNSKGKNGEEFMNELASISWTSHVNIVTLLGFCFEGSHRALIYEFMPNGSLEKFIYDEIPQKSNRQLGWETLYRIAIGIARGLEYLHRGCNTRILHFDIKPHNILLDGDFCPKISDFGLAKLCSQKESIISMLGTRGTAGYIAPEVFCRNIGGVSHKSDVYSFGMMVLEMVGGRKNIDVGVGMDHTSQIYFPHWIYNRIESNNELGLHGGEITMDDEENEKARKMILVSLWCIQTDPSNRPPMSRVLEMLEGKLESLQIPPKPFLSSPSRAPLHS